MCSLFSHAKRQGDTRYAFTIDVVNAKCAAETSRLSLLKKGMFLDVSSDVLPQAGGSAQECVSVGDDAEWRGTALEELIKVELGIKASRCNFVHPH